MTKHPLLVRMAEATGWTLREFLHALISALAAIAAAGLVHFWAHS